MGVLRQEALKKGCHSAVCLPLVVNDAVTGVIILFATGTNFFDKDKLALLNEVVMNLSFALQAGHAIRCARLRNQPSGF